MHSEPSPDLMPPTQRRTNPYAMEPSLASWVGMCEHALADDNLDLLMFYLQAAQNAGLDPEQVLEELQQAYPDNPLVDRVLSTLTSQQPSNEPSSAV